MNRVLVNPGLINPPRLLVILVGPTAAGKTTLAIQLAQHFRTEIISADSRQFYREMRIGTAVPSAEELALVPHHFIGHLSIHEDYNVYRYEKDVLGLLDRLFQHHETVIMTGGSGLYVRSVLRGIDDLPDPDPILRKQLTAKLLQEGISSLQAMLRELDPEYYATVDQNNPKRLLRAIEVSMITGVPFSLQRSHRPKKRDFGILQIGITLQRDSLYQRINERVDRMMENGLLEEARLLYPFRHLNALNTVGYKELFEYLSGEVNLEEAVKNIKTHTRKYAKRQLTWFRQDASIHWLQPDGFKEMTVLISSHLR
ncbi:MAG: tRNA (adenosine(37)-N6)-dimethylallyltransferase MiaA [Bacteroidales bacterium]|nr:tRNA (adenosine(37)-N6)-dimethylallyltransferase MiaA [Lentimicrobiaceae bacterium]MDD5694293.1 tRNA (adenosine(37)-N6)-dimethylallyltransferase MiaA [Bacteroidales bacterium]